MFGDLSPERLNAALRYLEASLVEGGEHPSRLNDLAVAYGLRDGWHAEPLDLLYALSASTRAVALAPDSAEIAFNHALFLGWADLLDASRAAWRSYLDRFAEPGFREEAEEQYLRTRERLAESVKPEVLDELVQEARNGRFGAAVELAARDPQRARELGADHLLGAWGKAWLSDEQDEAERVLAAARQLGSRLAIGSGDCTVSSAVAAIQATTDGAPCTRTPRFRPIVLSSQPSPPARSFSSIAATLSFSGFSSRDFS